MSNSLKAPIVYLAGGMRTNWQDQVIAAFPGVMFIDPRKSGSSDELTYTAYDLTGVQMADIVFGYMEADNPNGAGLALEFGFAASAGNKYLVYVEQPEFKFSRYFGMVRSVSDDVYPTLAQGMERLAQLCGFDPRRPSMHSPFTAKDGRPSLTL